MFPFHNLTEQEECELLFECRFLVPHSDFHISIVVWVWESSCMLGEWLIFPPRCRFLWIPGATDWCGRTVSTELAPGSIIWLEIWFKVFCMGLNWKKQFSYSDNSCSKTFNVYKWLLRAATWGTSLEVHWLRFCPSPVGGMWFLARELRSDMLHSAVKKYKNKLINILKRAATRYHKEIQR